MVKGHLAQRGDDERLQLFTGGFIAHKGLREKIVKGIHFQTEIRKHALDLREQIDEFVGPLDLSEFGKQFFGGAFAAESVEQFGNRLIARVLQDIQRVERDIEQTVGRSGDHVVLSLRRNDDHALGRVGDVRGDLLEVDQTGDLIEDRGVRALFVGGQPGNREFRDLFVEKMDLAVRLFFSAPADQADQRAVKVDLESAVLAVGGSLSHGVEFLVVVVEREVKVDRVGLFLARVVGFGRGALDRAGDHDTAVAERVDALKEGRKCGLARLVFGDFDDLVVLGAAASRHQAGGENENEAKQKRKKSGFHCLFLLM